MRKWVNSRRFVICLMCLVIIGYSAIYGDDHRVTIATALVPVLVAFMGATTVEKVGEEFGKMKWGKGDRGGKEEKDGE